MHLIPGLSATESLSQSDAPTTARQWAAAQAYDRQRNLNTSNRAAVRVGRITLTKRVLVDLMAGVIIEAALKRGCVAQADFDNVSIDKTTVATYRAEAFDRAAAREPRLRTMLEVV